MRAHWVYFKYVVRHKWFVFLACLKLGVPLHLAILHDWSKFLPVEWFPYVHSFYNPDGSKRDIRDQTGYYDPTRISYEFNRAWLHHQKYNAHHWQYWVLVNDTEPMQALEMPQRYLLEMVADWIGAGRAIGGRTDPRPWYEANKGHMILNPLTRADLEIILAVLK